jgi:hypothetical protein
MWCAKVAFNDDRLFILDKPTIKGGTYDLVCYEKNLGRTPRHIPLQFHLSDSDRVALSNIPPGLPSTWNIDQIDHPDTTVYPSADVQFFAAKEGLCIQPHNVGFWFLPYSDIEAYLKAHPMDQSDSAPPQALLNNARKPGATPAGGDTINPGDPTSFR